MKRKKNILVFMTLSCILSFMQCQPVKKKVSIQTATSNNSLQEVYTGPAKFKFDSLSYYKGILKKGQILDFEIPFINQGGTALEIKLITACECTKVDWPVLPISSGQKRVLKIRYDSKDKIGKQIVDLDIMANTEPKNTYIKFELWVEE